MNTNKKTEKSGKIKNFLVMALVLIGSMAVGVFIADTIFTLLGDDMGFGEYFFWLLLYLFVLYAAYFLQIIIHESGHLIFGLLTGYRFSSFRIGSVILTKDGGKFRIGSFSMAGTAGQCLLYPNEGEEKIPYVGVAAFALMAASGDLGASLAPQLMGIIADRSGLRTGMLVCLIFPALGTLLMIFTVRFFRKKNKEA